jgi:3-carboxy-cis,cis-muconate cycloisomerase
LTHNSRAPWNAVSSTVFDSFYFKDRFGTSAMREIWSDRTTLQKWLDVEVALARVEAELGLIPRRAATEISRAARLEKLDLTSLKQAFDLTWNPIVPLVDELRKTISKRAAGFVHWGATSKNIFDTGMMLQVRSSYDVLLDHLWSVSEHLAKLAATHRDTVMAGRTHGQHALPVTLGFKAAVWLDELLRHEERLRASRRRVLVGEFGGAVGTLASLGKDGLRVQKRLMERLGLFAAEVPVKTSGDRIAEFTLLLCMLSSTLGKIAQNVYNLQQTDIDEVTEFNEGKVGSSAMPHKQNPVLSGSIVLLGRLLRGNATAALDYIHAEGEDDHRQGESAWKFLPEVCLLADAQLAMSDRLLETLVVKPENMQLNLERAGALVCSEAILMRLAPALGRDRAHELVQRLSSRARAERRSLREVAAENETVRSNLTPKEIARTFDYRAYLGETDTLIRRVLKIYEKRSKTRQ